MSQEALLNLVYQLSIVLAGILIASLAMRFRVIILQWMGAFMCVVAAIWAAWTAIDELFVAVKPFQEKWLGLAQVVAVIVAAFLIFVTVLYCTGRPKIEGEEATL